MFLFTTEHHSTYSFLDGYALPETHVERAAELGMGALCLTEHGNVSSHVKLEVAATKIGVKPLYGCELYCGDTKEETRKQRKNHLTVIAEDQEGYKSLLRTVSQGWSDFYYEPTVSGPTLVKNKQGLIILSGCTGSLLATSLVGGKNVAIEDASYERGKQVAARFKHSFGSSYYLEVQSFPELEVTKKLNPMIARIGRELGIPLVATGDVHYTKPSENDMQQILHNVRGGNKKTLEQMSQEWGYDVPLSPPLSDKAVLERLIGTGLSRKESIRAILATEEIAQRCVVTLPKLPRLRFPLPIGFKTGLEVWKSWLRQGWEFRGCNRLSGEQQRRYKKQLKYEMGIIEDKDFIDYFLVVSDIVKFAKDSGIPVGPARGSAAASIVCWLLRITEVNPMLFTGLVFERFIDITRQDLPDIDLDFDSERRHEIRDYAISKYGRGNVGNIGTFSTYKAKVSLDDVARVYRIPQFEVDTVKDLLLERSSGDLRASATIEDTVEQFEQAKEVFERWPDLRQATRLEGNVKGMGVHAAGLIVSNGPITDVCAIYAREVKGELVEVISLDKYDAERQNLIKIDILGLNTMSMIAEAMRMLDMKPEDLYGIPLDDPKIIQGFKDNDVVGIFQFDGRAMRSVNAELQPDNFKEICDVNALARPGPLHNNASAEYIDIKKGRKEAAKVHPLLDVITADTHYQIVYQEQILRIVREIGGFDWTHAAYIRKIISKKLGEQEFQRQWERFWEGANERGVPEDVAKKIWGNCITAGSYAFCLTGDAVVETGGGGSNGGQRYTLKELWEAYNSKTSLGQKLRTGQNGRRINLRQLDDDGRIRPGQFKSIKRSDFKQPIYKVVLQDGRSFKGSLVHRVLTTIGYKDLGELQVDDMVICQDLTYQYKQPKPQVTPAVRSGSWDDGRSSWFADGRQQALEDAQLQVWIRSGGICEHCSRPEEEKSNALEYAHVIEFTSLDGDIHKYHSVNNILLLCNSCHKKFDYAKGERKGRDSIGKPTIPVKVKSVTPLKDLQWVYMLEMNTQNFNYLANGAIHHNNLAHCVSYGMLAYWTMWLKQYHPQVFYVASLMKYDDKRQLEFLRDAHKHGISALPPDPGKARISWRAYGDDIMAGFSQIPGIGEKTGKAILDFRAGQDKELAFGDLLKVRGIGQKTVDKMVEFNETDDPFKVQWLHRKLENVRNMLKKGEFGNLPVATHTSQQVPYSRGDNVNVVWLGILIHRNLRDLFESNFARTGVALDPEEVKDPHLREWVIGVGADEDELVSITWDRWKYPKSKRGIWDIKLDHDIVLVRGVKKGYQARRAIYVKDFWVIDPD